MYQCLVTAGILLAASYTDLRDRRIPLRLLILYILLAAAGHALMKDMNPTAVCFGLLPGAVCFVVSLLSRQALGFGDSLLVLILGLSCGAAFCLTALFFAFLGAGVLSLILVLKSAGNRKREIAFVPFLFTAVLICDLFAG